MAEQLNSLELCSGAGGLALGIAMAGFCYSAVVELDNACCETLRHNKLADVEYVRNWDVLESDISEMDFAPYRGIDLLSGGPPCQPFSQGGTRNGRSDKRDMFPHLIRAIQESAPKAFIIENVKGLLDRSFVNYFNYLIHQLRFPEIRRKKCEKWTEHRARLERLYTSGKQTDLKYNVISQVLNGANFGVPQRRNRVFIVGIRADLEIEYSFPLPTHSRESLWFEQWITGEYWERHDISVSRRPSAPSAALNALSRLQKRPVTAAWRTVRDAIQDLPNVGLGRTSHKVSNHFFNPGARAYAGHEGSCLDTPAKTIKAGHNGVPGGENMLRLDDETVRYFTGRECARLQTFPDEWTFQGSWCTCMRQVGNAVPPALAKIVAGPLAKALIAKSDTISTSQLQGFAQAPQPTVLIQ
jgi:DNA (cytosine-5)-methyltransferase 1